MIDEDLNYLYQMLSSMDDTAQIDIRGFRCSVGELLSVVAEARRAREADCRERVL
jgi:hypothetical protein